MVIVAKNENCYEIWCRCFGTHTVQNTLGIVSARAIQTELMVICDFSSFYGTILLCARVSVCVCVCLISFAHILCDLSGCFVRIEMNWFFFLLRLGFFSYLSLSLCVSTFVFLRHLWVVQKLGPSIVMTTHNSYYIIASISEWMLPLESKDILLSRWFF